MLLNHFSRRGNALLLTTIILALVVTGMLSLTDQLLGRKQLADFSRVTLRAQETADNVAEALCDRIKSNASLLTADFASSGTGINQLDNWLTRGFVNSTSDIASVKGIWLNDCVVYWRLEPVTAFDHTMTDTTGDGVIQNADVVTNKGVKYMTNRSLDIAAGATTPEHDAAPAPIRPVITNRLENSGLLFFEMTVDAFAMTAQNRMSANPLDAATNSASSHSGDRSPFHAQIKKRVLVRNVSLFRYVIFYSATGPTGDFELEYPPNVTVVGAVHTNGAIYLGHMDSEVIFGSDPHSDTPTDSTLVALNLPVLKSIPMTAVDGFFSMSKYEWYQSSPSDLNPMNFPRGTAQGNNYQSGYAYINAAKLKYEKIVMGGLTLAMPTRDTTSALPSEAADSGPFTMARDSRPLTGSYIPLNGYNEKLVKDKLNRGLKTIDITRRLGMNGYRPLEPFALVGPNVPLLGVNGSYSILNGTGGGIFATDMMLFKKGTTVDVSVTQNNAGTSVVPIKRPSTVTAFTLVTKLPNLVPPPICHVSGGMTNDEYDIFSNLGTHIIPPIDDGSPSLGTYIRNPLGLNAAKTPGVGIVILERASQAGIDQWPSGRKWPGTDGGRRGKVSWDPPSVFSTDEPNNDADRKLSPYYDSNQDGIIDPDMDINRDGIIDNKDHKTYDLDEQGRAFDAQGNPVRDGNSNGQMTAFLMDYCQWMRSNYVVYFGVNGAGTALVDITDQFFSVPNNATGLDSLLAKEDVFKDRREATWRESSANGYATTRAARQKTPAADFDNIRVNALTLNIAAINNFISTTPLNELDPGESTNTQMASTRFNGTIYAARTPRYSALPAGTTLLLGVSQNDFDTKMFTYRAPGVYDPIAPLGFNQTWARVNGNRQDTALPSAARDGLSVGSSLLYPVVGRSSTATVNGYPSHTNVAFGSDDSWSCYPLLKRVRVRNGGTINWGGRRSSQRNIGVTIYTPNVCYLQGHFNVVPDGQNKFPACALYCDGLVALSESWSDAVANGGPSEAQYSGVATPTVHRLCLVIHNNPTDLGNVTTPNDDVSEPGGSGGVHNVIKFLEDWDEIDWAFIGSLVVLDRSRYTRGYLGNGDVYYPPTRHYNFNEDLKIELPPFPDVINDVYIW